jgi:phage baseplate assembly protein W
MTVGKFDIHLESVPVDQLQGPQFLTFGPYERVLGVRGIQKMVDRFMKCMMTPIGSDVSDPEYGTQLAASFLGNVSPGDLFSIAAQAVATAEQKIREYDSDQGTPDEERLAATEIENIYIDEGGLGVVLVVRLRNAAGTLVQSQMSTYMGASNV